VYDSDGQFVRSFGERTLKFAWDFTATNDGRVMVVDRGHSCVQIFSEDGDHLNQFKLQGSFFSYPEIAFHRASDHVVVAGIDRSSLEKPLVHLEIYTKDGEFVHSTQIHEGGDVSIQGITVTMEGRIAVLLKRLGYVLYDKVLVV
jgi:hypothetical protein